MRTEKPITPFLLLLLTLLWATSCEKKPQDSVTPPMPVKIQRVAPPSELPPSEYVGQVQESLSVPVSFLSSGQLEQVFVAEGEAVTKGQPLAQLAKATYENIYKMSLAKEKQAQDGYNRLAQLYEKGSLPEVKFIEIQTNLEQAKLATTIAKRNLDDCTLLSPLDGLVGKRTAQPGMNILPEMPVFTLVKIHSVFVHIAVPEQEISRTSKGQKGRIGVPALQNEVFEGIVQETGVIANLLSHTYSVKMVVPNKSYRLKPGMVCTVKLFNQKHSGALVVPQQAVQKGTDGKPFLYIVDTLQQKALQRTVVIGPMQGNGITVTEGLTAGEHIVIEGYQNLFNGAPITIR